MKHTYLTATSQGRLGAQQQNAREAYRYVTFLTQGLRRFPNKNAIYRSFASWHTSCDVARG